MILITSIHLMVLFKFPRLTSVGLILRFATSSCQTRKVSRPPVTIVLSSWLENTTVNVSPALMTCAGEPQMATFFFMSQIAKLKEFCYVNAQIIQKSTWYSMIQLLVSIWKKRKIYFTMKNNALIMVNHRCYFYWEKVIWRHFNFDISGWWSWKQQNTQK